jgi:two-component system phosphate regulon response regulator PhoB
MAGSILVIEDDPTLSRSICRNLTARGYAASAAMSVAEATAAIGRELPSLLVVDIDLPDGSGWEVLRSLRQDGHADVRAIVMSALRPNPRLARELCVIGVLEKPFPIQSLLRLIAGVMDPAAPAHSEDNEEKR